MEGDMLEHDSQSYRINTRVYHHGGISRHYRLDTLAREDGVALLKYQPAFAGKDVLDIGAGTGRTAIYLAPLAHRYQAIDYSPAMVRGFEGALPGIPIALADMRDLSRFGAATFDFVLASNNVFDAVDHADRLRTLQEVHRVLRPGGILMFSAHYRDVRQLWRWPRLHFARNPATQAKQVVHWGLSLVNHARLRGLQEDNPDYAIVNDEAHDCGLLQYYIGPEAQRRQLANLDFDLLETMDSKGSPLAPGERGEHSRRLLYVVRRLPLS
jgi:SAM-dependent methyltransferase